MNFHTWYDDTNLRDMKMDQTCESRMSQMRGLFLYGATALKEIPVRRTAHFLLAWLSQFLAATAAAELLRGRFSGEVVACSCFRGL